MKWQTRRVQYNNDIIKECFVRCVSLEERYNSALKDVVSSMMGKSKLNSY